MCIIFNNHDLMVQEVSDMERDKTARWLVQLSQAFDFAPETYVLAVALTDRVAQHVKVCQCKKN